MSNIYVGLGRIIRVVNKTAEELGTESNLLELTVAVYTGEKKKNEDDYPPQIIFKLALWGKYGDVLSDKVEVGSRVSFSGELGTPEYYEDKEGEIKISLKIQPIGLKLRLVDKVEDSGDSKPAYTPKAKGKVEGTKRNPNSDNHKPQGKSQLKPKPAVTFEDDDIDEATDMFDS